MDALGDTSDDERDDSPSSRRNDGQPRHSDSFSDSSGTPDGSGSGARGASGGRVSAKKSLGDQAWGTIETLGRVEQIRNPRLSKAQGIEKALRTADGKDMVGIMDEVPVSATAYREPREFAPIAKSDAWSAIEREASGVLAKADRPMTRQKAIVEAMRRRPDLVRQYDAERRMQLVG